MSDLLAQARAGDELAFEDLVGAHRRELHVHCYRMLGSVEDAEDAVQETLLRAWSRISTYAGDSTFRAWLYAIATNACLDALRRRRRRQWPTDVAAGSPGTLAPPARDVPWLGPYPDAYLVEESAEDAVVRRESIELAFLVALQELPPRQRAVLIMRDVLAWSAKETAAALGITPTAVNSALQRARGALEPVAASARPRPPADRQRDVLARFMDAWERADVAGLAGLLADDARLVMPPVPQWFDGRTDVVGFLERRFDAHRDDAWRLVPTAANGLPACAMYLRVAGAGDFRPFAIVTLSVREDGIDDVTLFIDTPFHHFGLPSTA